MRFVSKSIVSSLIISSIAWADPFPMTVFKRPFTMPQNAFESTLRFTNDSILKLGLDYGVTDNFQFGISWDGMEAPSGATPLPKRAISLNAGHYLYSTSIVSSMATFSLPIHFQRMILQKVSMAAPMYFHVLPGHVNLVLFDEMFTLNWLEETQAQFHFSTRLSWQATHVLCLNLLSKIGTLSTTGDHTHVIQSTPLNASALYSITPLVDIVTSVGFDNIQNASGFSMILGVNFRAGEIEG